MKQDGLVDRKTHETPLTLFMSTRIFSWLDFIFNSFIYFFLIPCCACVSVVCVCVCVWWCCCCSGFLLCVCACLCCARSLSLFSHSLSLVCTDKWKLTTAEQQRPELGACTINSIKPRLVRFFVVVVVVVAAFGEAYSDCVDCPFIGWQGWEKLTLTSNQRERERERERENTNGVIHRIKCFT